MNNINSIMVKQINIMKISRIHILERNGDFDFSN